jgi:hypothetical protein
LLRLNLPVVAGGAEVTVDEVAVVKVEAVSDLR